MNRVRGSDEDERSPAKPVPDPTMLTMDAIARAIAAERDYETAQFEVLRERLAGIDRATVVLNEIVTRVPTDVQKEVSHLRELSEEKFRSVQTQFTERDNRAKRESEDNKVAVNAAFAAADKAADERNKSNTLAISKSETATAETIAKLNELFRTSIDALSDKLDDLKERVGRIESIKQGGKETTAGIYQVAAFVGLIITVVIAVLAYRAGGG